MSFFTFQEGNEARSLPPPDSSLRYGRFRAFADHGAPKNLSSIGTLFSAFTGELLAHSRPGSRDAGYGSISIESVAEVGDTDDEGEGEDHRWWVDRLLISPRRSFVKRVMKKWYTRWLMLIILPAFIVSALSVLGGAVKSYVWRQSILWCAVPFPTYPIDEANPNPVETQSIRRRSVDDVVVTGFLGQIGRAIENVFDWRLLWGVFKSWLDAIRNRMPEIPPDDGQHVPGGDGEPYIGGPGHGSSRVVLNFYFFLVPYYAFYNLVGLLWITKIFNMYSLNWWPPQIGFPPTFTMFNILPLLVAVCLYALLPGALIVQNLVWRLLSFAVMCSPLLIAFLILLFERRNHRLGHRRGLSETQLLFPTSSPRPQRGRGRGGRAREFLRTKAQLFQLPRSYTRFLWFCSAVLLTLCAFVLGEVYSEMYLRTLPHTSLETVIYVWSWVASIYILDALTAWIIGAKIGSYPLGIVFKLYFMLTYQTYVRALYARLRSPSQFIYLQLLSSSIVVVWSPLMMTHGFHRLLCFLRINTQPYSEYRKNIGRSFFIRGIAENVSMAAWLGWVVVLHYGYNKKIYPYFSFEDKRDPYTFSLTFWASCATWVAEICAGWAVRRIMRYRFGFRVTTEAVADFGRFPELLPAVGLVSVHVLTSMLLSIVRVRFY